LDEGSRFDGRRAPAGGNPFAESHSRFVPRVTAEQQRREEEQERDQRDGDLEH